MANLPMKSRLLKAFKGTDGIWDHEAVESILASEGKSKSEHWRMTARFWLMEMAGGGLIESVEEAIGVNSYFGHRKVQYRYKLTDLGKNRVETMLED
jgi:hypothetical protein